MNDVLKTAKNGEQNDALRTVRRGAANAGPIAANDVVTVQIAETEAETAQIVVIVDNASIAEHAATMAAVSMAIRAKLNAGPNAEVSGVPNVAQTAAIIGKIKDARSVVQIEEKPDAVPIG